MGGVVKAVSNAIGSVVKGVGKVVSSIGKTVVNTVKGALKNPIGTIAKVAAIASGQLWALPIIDGAQVLANGGSLGDALKTGAISAAGTWAMSSTGFDLAGKFGSALGNDTLGSVAANALRGGTTAALTGGNFVQGALEGGLQAGVAGGVNSLGVSDWIKDSALGASLGATGAQIATNAITGGLKGALTGRGLEEGISSGVTGGLFNFAGKQLSDTSNTVSNFLAKSYNETGEQLENIANEFQGSFNEAQQAEQTFAQARDSYESAVGQSREELISSQSAFDNTANTYNSKLEEYNTLLQQHEDLSAAGDTAAADELLGTINQRADELNQLYTDYEAQQADLEGKYAQFEAVHNENLDTYNTAQEAKALYDTSAAKIQELDTAGAALKQQLEKDQEALDKQALDKSLAVTSGEVGNEQIFDDGSSITTFDDGSQLVKDAMGGVFTYDSSGQLFTGTGADLKPAAQGAAPQGQASAWSKMFQGLAKAGAGIGGAAMGARGAMGRGPSNLAGGQAGTPGSPDELGSENEFLEPKVEQAAPVAPKEFNPFGFLQKEGKLSYIPGVTEALGFKPPSDTEYMTLGTSPLPMQAGWQGSQEQQADQGDDIYGYDPLGGYNQTDPMASLDNSYLDLSPYAEGGHVPEFFSEGGMRHVRGGGDGTSDEVPALLSSGEYVIPAQVVSSLGNGDNEAGSGVLDRFVKAIREHKRSNDSSELEPDSLGPLAYLQQSMNGA